MLHLVLVLLALQGADDRGCRRARCRDATHEASGAAGTVVTFPTSPALFEFAPVSGSGMGTACSCGTPSGSNGEAMTFTRGSSGTCLRGGTLTGIANGDMVTCASNQPRVMPGGDGSGGLGMLVERLKTNIIIQSQALDSASWATSTTSTLTVTADQAVAPDGTTTAERLQIGAIGAGGESVRYQLPALSNPQSGSFFVKGNGTSGTLDIHLNSSGGACVSCSYVSTSWTRCVDENKNGSGILAIGLESNAGVACPSGSGAKGAADVFVWGGQVENAAFASSYIATTSAAASRASDVGYFVVSLPASTGWSESATYVAPNGIISDPFAMEVAVGANPSNNRYDLYVPSPPTFTSLVQVGGVSNSSSLGSQALAGATSRLIAFYDGVTQFACVGTASNCSGTARSYTPFSPTEITVGNFASTGGDEADGVVKQLCYDNTAGRCR